MSWKWIFAIIWQRLLFRTYPELSDLGFTLVIKISSFFYSLNCPLVLIEKRWIVRSFDYTFFIIEQCFLLPSFYRDRLSWKNIAGCVKEPNKFIEQKLHRKQSLSCISPERNNAWMELQRKGGFCLPRNESYLFGHVFLQSKMLSLQQDLVWLLLPLDTFVIHNVGGSLLEPRLLGLHKVTWLRLAPHAIWESWKSESCCVA
jgi:hypothetical protein